MKNQLTSSEAVYGFAAWLTCRNEKLIISAKHNAAPIAELVKEFCEANNLPEPRDNYHKILVHPRASGQITTID